LSVATVRGGALATTQNCGVRDTRTNEPVDGDTIFEAAALSKPVVAYVVLRLVDAGEFDLDQPLSRFVPRSLLPIPPPT
jgi:CubicO group peptidase (beta-lactamase class C family)